MSLIELSRLITRNKRRVLRIVYDDNQGTPRPRFVRPYEIKEENKFSYLFATEITRSSEAIRKFRLDRIESAQVTPMTYTPQWPLQF